MNDPFLLRELLGAEARLCRRALSGEPGVALPPLIDVRLGSTRTYD